MFAAATAPLTRLKATAGALLLDLCTAAPERMVGDLWGEDVWRAGAVSISEKGGAGEGLSSLSDSLLPLPAITQVWVASMTSNSAPPLLTFPSLPQNDLYRQLIEMTQSDIISASKQVLSSVS